MKKSNLIILVIFASIILLSQRKDTEKIFLRDNYMIESEDECYLKLYNDHISIFRGKKELLKVNDFKAYIDQFGYKQIEIGADRFTVMDGINEYLIISYNSNWGTKTHFFILPDNIINGNIVSYSDAYLNGKNIGNISSSSELHENTITYSASNVLRAYAFGDVFWYWVKDNHPWVEGVKGFGENEFIEFDIKMYNNAESNRNKRLILLNGYVNPEKPYLFYQNNRLKEATLIIDGREKKQIHFNDYVEFKEIELQSNVKKIRIVINNVYKGNKYDDTCITSIAIR